MRSLVALAIAATALARRLNTKASAKAGVINVHVVPHTHDDVGWLKTPDQYFWGGNFSIQNAGVQYVIDSVLDSLRKNPDRKFIYVEQAFFDMWWRHADPEDQATLEQLVSVGQLEFINGGWTMHDEASPSYVDMIDQTTLGVRNIKTRFNVAPKVTWQIDPFGHSGTQSSMLTAASGYEGLYFGRADYQDRANRIANNCTEYFWRASASQPGLQHFTGLMNGYGPPSGAFNWDIRQGGFQAMIDDPESPEYNVPYLVDMAVQSALSMANYTRAGTDGTIHLMWTMGSDFEYIGAQSYFSNLDRLVHYLNADGRVNAFYSTPSIYTEAKLAQVASGQVTWPVTASSDLFPYGDSAHAYWTGYFTSRAAIKGYVRASSNYLQASRQAQVMAGGAAAQPDDPANPLFGFERALGTLQHHDGVSGTEKQHVAYAYARNLAIGRTAADTANSAAYASITNAPGTTWATCDLANATICPATEAGTGPVALLLWNSRGQSISAYPVRVPVGMPNGVSSYSVSGPDGSNVAAQLLPTWAADQSLRTAYYKANNAPVTWLTFMVTVPPAGYAVYVLSPAASISDAPLTAVTSARSTTHKKSAKAVRGADNVLSNGIVSLTFDAASGALKSYSGPGVPAAAFSQTWMWYNASTGNNALSGQPSGAYIFRPNGTTPNPVSTAAISNAFVNGPLVWEARQAIGGGWITQVIRLYAGRADIEVEYTVGPVPMGDGMGKEIIARYSVNGMNTAATWYTDSNGRDMYPRVRNFRPTWTYNITEPVAGNYYPVNTRISTSDVSTGLTLNIVTDRTQSGSSMVDGTLELMVQRRLTADDHRGVGEPLSEPGLDATGSGIIIRGTHRIGLDASPVNGSITGRSLMQDQLFPPTAAYSTLAPGTNAPSWLQGKNSTGTLLSGDLPANVHLLTVHSYSPTSLLVRLAHLYGVEEAPSMAANVTVDLSTLFKGFTVVSATETTLIGNQALADVLQRRVALSNAYGGVVGPAGELVAPDGTILLSGFKGIAEPVVRKEEEAGMTASMPVTLGPMEIRTFMCQTSVQGM